MSCPHKRGGDSTGEVTLVCARNQGNNQQGAGKGGWPTCNARPDASKGKAKGKGGKGFKGRPMTPPDEFKKLASTDASNPNNPESDIC